MLLLHQELPLKYNINQAIVSIHPKICLNTPLKYSRLTINPNAQDI